VHTADAEKLQRNGYVTIRMLPKEACAAQRDAFKASLLTFPEYLRDAHDPTRTPTGEPIVYVAGAFGGLGNPASYHCDHARRTRECVLAGAMPLLGALERLPRIPEWEATLPAVAVAAAVPPIDCKADMLIAALMERNSVRSAGTNVGAESCHFDSSPKGVLKHGDQVFGCIVNINDEPIVRSFLFFSCFLFLFCVTSRACVLAILLCSLFGVCRAHTLRCRRGKRLGPLSPYETPTRLQGIRQEWLRCPFFRAAPSFFTSTLFTKWRSPSAR
jgi:hypothetical protein